MVFKCLSVPVDKNTKTPKHMNTNPLIITVAGVGAELTKKDTPYLPTAPDEIILEAKKVFKLGAHVFHLHVRDDHGKPTCDPKRIKEIAKKIKQETDLIIQVSTGGAIGDTLDDRLNTLDADVEMGSLTLGNVKFGKEVFLNTPEIISALAQKMRKKKIRPELEIFDINMVDTTTVLLDKGLISPPLHFNIILGGPGWLEATVENLENVLKKLPKDSTWSASGVGNPHAQLMFVGEGPGGDEDRQGEPFVGRAGKLLTRIIEAMGLKRSDVYIANIVKCRPPGNRNPEPVEIATCLPFLKKQIDIINPKVIVCLGKVAAHTLLQTEIPITKLRGELYDYGDSQLMPTYHPAYLLRNPAMKKPVWEDLKKVMALLGIPRPANSKSQ